MNRLPLILLAWLLCCPCVFADGTNASEPVAIIRAKGADMFYNQTAMVTGKVAQVTFRPKTVFINLDEPYPNSPFSAVIFAQDTNKFGELPDLKGKSIGITGTVKQYDNKPEIVLTNASQLKVLEPEKK